MDIHEFIDIPKSKHQTLNTCKSVKSGININIDDIIKDTNSINGTKPKKLRLFKPGGTNLTQTDKYSSSK